MSHGVIVQRGGAYNRLAEPAWGDPLRTSYSCASGGRWNAPGSYGVLYLNATERMARLQAEHKLTGQPFGIEDLDPFEQHDLVDVVVGRCDVLDCVTDAGLRAVALPVGYPRERDGSVVSHARCHPVGEAAHDAGLAGVVCRSAVTGATPADEELGVFDRDVEELVVQTARRPFADWYLG